MSDVKALADWIRAGAPFDPENWGQHQDQLDAAADALEASAQAPAAVDKQSLAIELMKAEALPMVLTTMPVNMCPDDDPPGERPMERVWVKDINAVVDHIIASGILQDAAEVEARGLEKGWDEGVKWLLVYDGGIYPEVADELHANPYRKGSK